MQRLISGEETGAQRRAVTRYRSQSKRQSWHLGVSSTCLLVYLGLPGPARSGSIFTMGALGPCMGVWCPRLFGWVSAVTGSLCSNRDGETRP